MRTGGRGKKKRAEQQELNEVKRACELFGRGVKRKSGNGGMYRRGERGNAKFHRVAGDSRFISPNRGGDIRLPSSNRANCACTVGTARNPILALSRNISPTRCASGREGRDTVLHELTVLCVAGASKRK